MALRRELKQFPLTCIGEVPPPPSGLIDHRGLHTPIYVYGWLVPYQQPLAAIEKADGKPVKTNMRNPVFDRWRDLGHADTYRLRTPPSRPALSLFDDKRAEPVLVYIATNDTPATINSAVSDTIFCDACKECLGSPKGMEQDAMWFRVDIQVVPDGYEYEFEDPDLVVCRRLMFYFRRPAVETRDNLVCVVESRKEPQAHRCEVCVQRMDEEKLPPIIDELGEDARLLWIGPRRLDHVVVALPPGDFLVSFWRHVQLELEKQNIEIGIALLNYSLAPIASFPTPLKQAHLALEFRFKAGVKPQKLQFVGDSAGGNLLLQVLSQFLHPRDAVPKIELSAPIRGALIVSPWVSLTGESKSHFEYDGIDFVGRDALKDWGSIVLSGIPETDRAFGEAAKAPEWWFDGVERLVDRVLITAGSAECLRDDIVVFAEAFKKHHHNVESIVQKDGLHEDFLLDFISNEKLVSLTPLVVE
ncbi:Alpha/Beta hydrolase protein [Mycena rebaudengoi]|nr:Alpha/Beta hydrolase protein [Mycena rebaudengoi]